MFERNHFRRTNPIRAGLFSALTLTLVTACGGGGGTTDTDTDTDTGTGSAATTFSVGATFVKGLVDGASCELFEVSAAGAAGTSIATGTTVAGVVDFGDTIEYEGTALVQCSGGTYTDEATGSDLTAPEMRAVVNIDGEGTFTVTPLTEIATQRAEADSDLGTALTTHNDDVASAFGLTGDITTTTPTDLETASAANDDAGQYATALALISQLNENDAGSLADVVDDLSDDLADGAFSTATLESLAAAEADLATSEVADNLSDDALATITASAGIPDADDNEQETDTDQPNILVILSDDQGLDSSAEYSFSLDPPNTPIITGLASDGVVFENVWATPSCATTRAAILTGQHGVNNGVTSSPGDIDEGDVIIHEFLAEDSNTDDYASAFIGKWHLASPITDTTNPIDNGISFFAGVVNGNIDSYDSWNLTVDSQDTTVETTTSTEYNTTELTDQAIDWVADQDSPWMLLLAYNAPHDPFHWPDESLHTQTGQTVESCSTANDTLGYSDTKRACYLAMIEAMDTEIGNLLDSMSTEERDNTVIIYVGDNGTAASVRDTLVFDNGEVKGTLFEGGVRVPMVVSGASVSRTNARETRLVTITDLYSTVAELAGSETTSIYDSLSFADYLSSEDGENRQHAYSDYQTDWSIRNDDHQLINDDGSETLYSLNTENFDITDVTANETAVLYELQVEAAKVRGELADLVEDGSDQGSIDITDGGDNGYFTVRASTCARFVKEYTATSENLQATDEEQAIFMAEVSIGVANGECFIATNGIPNHDMQDTGNFATLPSEQTGLEYEITATPEFADELTELEVGNEQGVFLNGVKIDLFAAACLGDGIETVGCGANTYPDEDDEWRFDPMFEDNGFGTDSHNAHTQPTGAYHYHGSPNALFDQSGDVESGVVGFAADGFPIYGSYISENGEVREVVPSYQVIDGTRPVIDVGGSSDEYSEQAYDGSFRQDYEYVEGLGDLDECNGMWVDGEYGYYVTNDYPYVLGCFSGTPDDSFSPSIF